MTFRLNDDDLYYCKFCGPYLTDIGGNAACVECGKLKEDEMTDANQKIVQRCKQMMPAQVVASASLGNQEDFDFCLLLAWQCGGMDAPADAMKTMSRPQRLREIGDER